MSSQTPLGFGEMIQLAIGAGLSSLIVSSGRLLTYDEAKKIWPYAGISIIGAVIAREKELKYIGLGAFAYGLAKTIVKVVSRTWKVENVS